MLRARTRRVRVKNQATACSVCMPASDFQSPTTCHGCLTGAGASPLVRAFPPLPATACDNLAGVFPEIRSVCVLSSVKTASELDDREGRWSRIISPLSKVDDKDS